MCVCVCVRECAVCIVRASLRAANVDRKCPSNMNPEDVQWKQQGLPDHNARFLPVNHSYARFVHANTCMQPAMHVFVHVYRNSSYYFDSMGSLDQICASASTWPMSTPTHTYILIHKTTNSYTNIQIHTCTCKHTHTRTHTHTHTRWISCPWAFVNPSALAQKTATPRSSKAAVSSLTMHAAGMHKFYNTSHNSKSCGRCALLFYGCYLYFELFVILV